MPQIAGHLLEIEDVPPYVNRDTGAIERDAFRRLHILDGREVIGVRVPNDFGKPLPAPGPVLVAVRVRAYLSRGQANLSWDLTDVQDVAAKRPAA